MTNQFKMLVIALFAWIVVTTALVIYLNVQYIKLEHALRATMQLTVDTSQYVVDHSNQ